MNQNQRRAAIGSTAEARTRMLEATSSLLATRGSTAVTSRAIAEASGENLGAITYYFGSKESLIFAAHVEAARSLIAPVVSELSNDQLDPVEKLLRSAQMLYRLLDEQKIQVAGYVQTIAASCYDDRVQAEVNDLHQGLRQVLESAIEAQKEEGLIPDWVQPLPMAQLIIALGNGVAVSVAIDPDRTDHIAIGSQFAQLLMAIRNDEA